jgi:DNA-binding CsgD family transcriptional regulator
MHFDKVHPNFFKKLKQLSADLTDENLKVCAYIKMGMVTKQIAQLLYITPKSVQINKYRLKKKLNLPEEEDLVKFICNL